MVHRRFIRHDFQIVSIPEGKMINVALLSEWHIHAKEYAEEISKTEGVNISAVWDNDIERGRRHAEKYQAAFEPDLDRLLARKDVDAVLVASSTNLHTEIITKSAKAGKHIFTEKVLAATYREAVEIASAVRNAGVKFCISLPFKSYPYNLFAKELVEKGTLGNITGLRIRDAHNGATAGWLLPCFYDPVESQGGAMLDLGAHPMYLSAWLLGRPLSVVSLFTHHTGKDLDDNASSVLEFPGGILVSSETSLVASRADMVLELYGTKGWFKYSGRPSRVKDIRLYVEGDPACEEEGSWVTPKLPPANPSPIAQWVREINSGAASKGIGIDDAVTLSLLMDGAYRSDREGRKVYFEELIKGMATPLVPAMP
jgi:predicted dehydrogenase